MPVANSSVVHGMDGRTGPFAVRNLASKTVAYVLMGAYLKDSGRCRLELQRPAPQR